MEVTAATLMDLRKLAASPHGSDPNALASYIGSEDGEQHGGLGIQQAVAAAVAATTLIVAFHPGVSEAETTTKAPQAALVQGTPVMQDKPPQALLPVLVNLAEAVTANVQKVVAPPVPAVSGVAQAPKPEVALSGKPGPVESPIAVSRAAGSVAIANISTRANIVPVAVNAPLAAVGQLASNVLAPNALAVLQTAETAKPSAETTGALTARLAKTLLGNQNFILTPSPNDRVTRSVERLATNDGKTFIIDVDRAGKDEVAVNPKLLQVVSNLLDKGIKVGISSMTTSNEHAPESTHYAGRGADLIFESEADFQTAFGIIYQNREAWGIDELIYGGQLPAGASTLRRGQPYDYNGGQPYSFTSSDPKDVNSTLGEHRDHLHYSVLADADVAPAATAPVASKLATLPSLVPPASAGLGSRVLVSVGASNIRPVAASSPNVLVVPKSPLTTLPTATGEAPAAPSSTVNASDTSKLAEAETSPQKAATILRVPPIKLTAPINNQYAIRVGASVIKNDKTAVPSPESLPINKILTAEVAQAMLPDAPRSNIDKNLPIVMQALHEFGLDDTQMAVFAIATSRPEVTSFDLSVREYGDYWKHYDPDPTNNSDAALRGIARDMGNVNAGDGYKYRGGSLGQLTWQQNYKVIGDMIGVDLAGHPELIEVPTNGARAFAAFIKLHESDIRARLTSGDLAGARRVYNGGTNGLAKFIESYQTGMALTKVG